MITAKDLEEMEQDLIEIDRDNLIELFQLRDELNQINEGTRIVLPKSSDHAKFMLLVAMNYLGLSTSNEPVTYH